MADLFPGSFPHFVPMVCRLLIHSGAVIVSVAAEGDPPYEFFPLEAPLVDDRDE